MADRVLGHRRRVANSALSPKKQPEVTRSRIKSTEVPRSRETKTMYKKKPKRKSAKERAIEAMQKTTLNGSDVAAIARVSSERAYAALKSGQISRGKRSGHWYRVTVKQVLNWVERGCPLEKFKE